MKLIATVTLGLLGVHSIESCGPVFRYRWAGPSKQDTCLTTTASGLTTAPCDDSNHSQMMVIASTNVPNFFFTGSHTSEEMLVEMKRTKMNTFTISTQGKCVQAKGMLGDCPVDQAPKGKGKKARKAKNDILKATWYVEPLLSVPFESADDHEGHDHSATMEMKDDDGHDHGDGHDHDEPTVVVQPATIGGRTSVGSILSSLPSGIRWGGQTLQSMDGHDHDDGHDHGHDHGGGSSASASSWLPAGHSMDDGHDHGGGSSASSWLPAGHSMDDGHDHGNTRQKKCGFVNGKFVCY